MTAVDPIKQPQPPQAVEPRRPHLSTLLVGWGWTWEQLRAGAEEIEDLGFDAIYIGDDLFPHPDVDTTVFDPWTVLPALAVATSQVRLGSLVSPVGRRHPGLFAKMTSGVDEISGGRLIVGMGAGNMPEQQASLHQSFGGPVERTAMLREELLILRSMWTRPRTTLHGTWYQVTDAICEPGGSANHRPEILVAAKSSKHLAPLAGELADRVNLLGNDDARVHGLVTSIRDHAHAFGRNPADMLFGRLASVVLTDRPVTSEDRLEAIDARARLIGTSPAELRHEHEWWVLGAVGTPEQVADELIRRTIDLGINELVICMDTIGTISYGRTMQQLRRFAADVAPAFRQATIHDVPTLGRAE